MTGPDPTYATDLGRAYVGDAVEVLQQVVEDETVDLIVTSPPFALSRPKEYGNVAQDEYVRWFEPFADEFWRILKPEGSLVIDLGGAWEPGVPVKSLYQFELLLTLCRRPRRRFYLAQDFYWYNPARLPSPAQWVTVERIRAKDAVNYIWWLAKSPHPKANNANVTGAYGPAMRRLLETGTYNRGRRPSGHVVREGFTVDRGGAIQPNLIVIANTTADTRYKQAVTAAGLPVHPARFPEDLPRIFIEMLTDEADLIVDPFCGSNVTGYVAERLHRTWISVDIEPGYVEGSRFRFESVQTELPHRGQASDE